MAALYDDGWYVGQVTSLDENEVFVNFLSTAGLVIRISKLERRDMAKPI